MKKRQVNFWNTYELKHFCINVLLWLWINICSTCWIHTDIWRHGYQPFSRGWQQTDVDDSSCEGSKVTMDLGILMLPGPPWICDRMFVFCFCFFLHMHWQANGENNIRLNKNHITSRITGDYFLHMYVFLRS